MRTFSAIFSLLIFFCSTPVLANDVFGSIAVSTSTSNFGYAGGEPTRRAAEMLAVKECARVKNQHPRDCKAVIWFKNNTCGAIAFDNHGNAGTGTGIGHKAAHEGALISCGKTSPGGCKVLKSVCPR